MASHHDAGATLSKRDWNIHVRIEGFYNEERALTLLAHHTKSGSSLDAPPPDHIPLDEPS